MDDSDDAGATAEIPFLSEFIRVQGGFNLSAQIFFQCDSHGIINAYDLFGENISQTLQGEKFRQLFPQAVAAQVDALLSEVVASQVAQSRQYHLGQSAMGYWVECHCLPLGTGQIGVLLRDISAQRHMELSFEVLREDMVATEAQAFFSSLAMQVAIAMHMSEVRIAQLLEGKLEILARTVQGIRQPNQAFIPDRTPCGVTLRQGRYFCSREVQMEFPDDPLLREIQVQSYMGVALTSATGDTIGTVCCLSSRPIENQEFAGSFLQMVADKVVAEFERRQNIQALEQLNQELEQRVSRRTQELQRSEQDLRTIFNTAYDGIYIHEYDGTIVDVNDRALEMHGLTRDQLMDLNIGDFSVEPPERVAQTQALLARSARGETLRFEWKGRNFKDPNRPIDNEVALRKALLSDREVIIATLRDIRERKQRELAMKTIIEGTAMKSGLQFFQICVDSLADIFHVPCAFLMDMQDGKLIQALHTEGNIEPSFLRMLSDQTLSQERELFISKGLSDSLSADSHLQEMESYLGVQIRDSQEQVLGVIGIVADYPMPSNRETVSFIMQLFAKHVAGEMERQIAAATIRKSQQQLLSFVDYSPAFISIKDLHGRYLLCNRVLADYLNLPISMIVGKTDLDLYPEDMAERIHHYDQLVLQQGHEHSSEEDITLQDGTRRSCLLTKFPLLDTNGQPYAVGSIATDITVQKQAELALMHLNEELENRVLQRTEELEQAIIRADCANKAKSEFLANMSHELRTPLNGVLGYTQILQRSKNLQDRDRHGLGVIHQCSSHLLTLINDILDVSKIEAEKLELNPTDVHLPALISGLIDICKIRVDYGRVDFDVNCPDDLPEHVQVDEKRLKQILLNLLSNAIKFTESGYVRFNISTVERLSSQDCPQPEERCLLRFEVEDSGIGIAAEHLDRLFTPFEQVSDRASYFEGSGLGLAISQRIANVMGSEIKVRSQLDVGSCFYFELSLPVSQSSGLVDDSNAHRPNILGADDYLRTPIVAEELFAMLYKHLQLTWIYEGSPPARDIAGESQDDSPLVVLESPPPPEIIEELLPLAQSGRLKKISQIMHIFTQTQPLDPLFIQQIEKLVSDFDCEALEKLLISYRS